MVKFYPLIAFHPISTLYVLISIAEFAIEKSIIDFHIIRIRAKS